jgi:hypothetical protein
LPIVDIDTVIHVLYDTYRSLVIIKQTLLTIVLSILTSIFSCVLFLFVYFRYIVPSAKIEASVPLLAATQTPKNPVPDSKFATYETAINEFFDSVRKGDIPVAYKSTSSVFQKKTTIDDFKKLITDYQTKKSIASSACRVTEYTDPLPSTIAGLADVYQIISTKCEAVEDGKVKGFTLELIEEERKPKISYIRDYTSPVLHKRDVQP